MFTGGSLSLLFGERGKEGGALITLSGLTLHHLLLLAFTMLPLLQLQAQENNEDKSKCSQLLERSSQAA